jgi:hypothetical protein
MYTGKQDLYNRTPPGLDGKLGRTDYAGCKGAAAECIPKFVFFQNNN